MSIFDDVSRFLEERLDEFLRNNPHLELQALEEQLREQAEDVRKLLIELQVKEKSLETKILETAKEVQLWHGRVQKAKTVGRSDLVKPAQEREAALLRQGNLLWGQMKGVKERIQQTQSLQRQIQQSQQELQAKAAQFKTSQPPSQQTAQSQSWSTTGWNYTSPYPPSAGVDPLEAKFKDLETDEELRRLKREMER